MVQIKWRWLRHCGCCFFLRMLDKCYFIYIIRYATNWRVPEEFSLAFCFVFSLFTTEGKKVIKNKASVYIMVVYFDLNWDLNHHWTEVIPGYFSIAKNEASYLTRKWLIFLITPYYLKEKINNKTVDCSKLGTDIEKILSSNQQF